MLAADLGQVGLVLALVDHVEEVFLQVVELILVEVAVQLGLHPIEELPPLRVFHEPEEQLVLRVAHLHLHKLSYRQVALLDRAVLVVQDLLGLPDKAVAEAGLVVHQAVDAGPKAREGLLPLDRRRPGDDQGGAGLVDQDRVDLVHDAVPVVALDLVLLAGRHAVVAEVVESELARGAVGDVAAVHLAAEVRGHLLLDAAHGDPQEGVKLAHPLRVAPGKVVVHRDQLGIPAVQRVQVKRQGRHERLALARRHLGDPSLMKGDAADQLDVKVDHVPGKLMLAHQRLGADQPAGRILHHGKRLGQDLVEGFAGRHPSPEFLGLRPELLVRKGRKGTIQLVDLYNDGAGFFEELLVVPSYEGFEQKRQH